jgi:hypothetical protein
MKGDEDRAVATAAEQLEPGAADARPNRPDSKESALEVAICSDFSEARNETRTRDPFLTIHERWATEDTLELAFSRYLMLLIDKESEANDPPDMSQYAAIDPAFCHSWNPSGRTA